MSTALQHKIGAAARLAPPARHAFDLFLHHPLDDRRQVVVEPGFQHGLQHLCDDLFECSRILRQDRLRQRPEGPETASRCCAKAADLRRRNLTPAGAATEAERRRRRLYDGRPSVRTVRPDLSRAGSDSITSRLRSLEAGHETTQSAGFVRHSVDGGGVASACRRGFADLRPRHLGDDLPDRAIISSGRLCAPGFAMSSVESQLRIAG